MTYYNYLMKKRWYDLDVTVSKAVAMWEKADEEIQVRCADYVIDMLKDVDIQMSLDDQYNYIMRRWYDKNIRVSHAMEYLKLSPEEMRKQLALDIIEYLKQVQND